MNGRWIVGGWIVDGEWMGGGWVVDGLTVSRLVSSVIVLFVQKCMTSLMCHCMYVLQPS